MADDATDRDPREARDLPGRATPDGVSDATVEALGALSEALETVERARGHLYTFHQLTGEADLALGDAVEKLRAAGHDDVADRVAADLVGRNVVGGRWTFQLVEDYDDGYWSTFRAHERRARDELAGGVRHLYEARMKQDRRSSGRAGHEAGPVAPA